MTIDSSTFWPIVADAALLVHVLFVSFVVGGLVLVYAGRAFGWSWVHGCVWRLKHPAAIGVVVVPPNALGCARAETAERERAADGRQAP